MNMSIDMFLDEALDTDPQLVPVSIVAFLEPSNSSENYQLFIIQMIVQKKLTVN